MDVLWPQGWTFCGRCLVVGPHDYPFSSVCSVDPRRLASGRQWDCAGLESISVDLASTSVDLASISVVWQEPTRWHGRLP
eukprot:3521667-Pyramimonas_sp.AAC.1